MNPNKILRIIGGTVIGIILIYSFMPSEKIPYTDTIVAHRSEIRDFMKNDAESPLSDSLKANFEDFDYFDPDPAFSIRSTVNLIPGNIILSLPTNTGEVRNYLKYAYATFEISGVQYQLTLFQPVDSENDDRLFLPFGDQTNGEITYGGGRYLDLEPIKGESVTIDFNLAYNPYCAYGADFSCPLPPSENRLPIAINAGEKNFNM